MKTTRQIQLRDIAYARSGDKGSTTNIGLIAKDISDYALLQKYVTPKKVKDHFGALCEGPVERFELPNIGALNFLLKESLDGGGTVSLRSDAQGKTYAAALLRMEILIDE